MFGISHSSVFDCVDQTIYAVNNCTDLNIDFSSNHDNQRDIANGFLEKSKDAKFACYVG